MPAEFETSQVPLEPPPPYETLVGIVPQSSRSDGDSIIQNTRLTDRDESSHQRDELSSPGASSSSYRSNSCPPPFESLSPLSAVERSVIMRRHTTYTHTPSPSPLTAPLSSISPITPSTPKSPRNLFSKLKDLTIGTKEERAARLAAYEAHRVECGRGRTRPTPSPRAAEERQAEAEYIRERVSNMYGSGTRDLLWSPQNPSQSRRPCSSGS